MSSPALCRFRRFLASKMKTQERTATSASPSEDAVLTQISSYLTDVAGSGFAVTGLDFWASSRAPYSIILPLAEDLLAAAASQAYVKRIFSLYGLLISGLSWDFLKLNEHIC